MKRWFQKKFVQYITDDLFNTVTEEELFQKNKNGKYTLQGKELRDEVIERLRQDLEKWPESVLWRALNNEVKFHANNRIYNKSQSTADIVAGKMALYNLQVIENKVETMKRELGAH